MDASAAFAQSDSNRNRERASSSSRSASARAGTSASSANFAVASIKPAGTAKLTDSIVVEFSADVARPESNFASSVLAAQPSLTGSVLWETPRRARIVPAGGLRKGTEYILKVNPTLKDTKGRTLAPSQEVRLRTPALSLVSAEQAGFTPDRRAIVQFTFSDDVTPTDLYKSLTMSDGAGARVNFELETKVRTARPRILTDALTTESLRFSLQPGLVGISGPLGLPAPVTKDVELKFKLQAESVAGSWVRSKPAIIIDMNNSVQMESVKRYLSVKPAVEFTVADSGSDLILLGDFKPQQRYEITVKKGLMGTNQQLLLRDVTLATWMPPLQPFVELVDAGGHLSPRGTMNLRVRSAGISTFRVQVGRVFDNNVIPYHRLESWESAGDLLGEEIANIETTASAANAQGISETNLDLRQILGAKTTGIFEVRVHAPAAAAEGFEQDYSSAYYYFGGGNNFRVGATIELSNLGVVGKVGDNSVAVWVGALDTAKPVAGVNVEVFSTRYQSLGKGTTGADGFVRLEKLSTERLGEPMLVVAQAPDGDRTSLDLRQTLATPSDDEATREFRASGYEAFATFERGAYRPGESMRVFGHVRAVGGGRAESFPLELILERPDGRRMEPQVVRPTATGYFEHVFRVPSIAPTGLYTARVQLAGAKERADREARYRDADEYGGEDSESKPKHTNEKLGEASFFLEEFLPNRLKVETASDTSRATPAAPIVVALAAEEMFGQPAAGRAIGGSVSLKAEPFAPKGFEEYTFGDSDRKVPAYDKALDDGLLDADGRSTVTVSVPTLTPPAALRARIQLTVKEAGGRGVTSALERVVDVYPYYIGIRNRTSGFAVVDKPVVFDLAAVRPDGTLADDAKLSATISRVRYNSILKREETGGYRYVTTRELQVVDSAEPLTPGGRGEFSWTPKTVGAYLIRIEGVGNRAATTVVFYASSGAWTDQPWSLEKPEALEVVLDKTNYNPGETAKVLVKAPFAGTLLLTLEQAGVVRQQIVEMTQNTAEVPVKVDETLLPNAYVTATVIRPVKPAERWLPHRAFGFANLRVDSTPRRLAVEIAAPVEVRPKSPLEFSVAVKDLSTSAPVAGEVALWAVDEGVLSLTNFETPDPAAFFYAPRSAAVATSDFYSALMPDILSVAKAQSSAGGGDEGARGRARRATPVPAERVRPVALWVGNVKTDANGTAKARVEVPQFLGRLRVMAVAAEGAKFGQGDREVFVRTPLVAQESFPRFFAPGDKASVPVTIFNNTNSETQATLKVESSEPLTVDTSSLKPVNVPAMGRVVVNVPVRAGDGVGRAQVKYSVTAGSETFGDTLEIPVRPASAPVRIAGVATVSTATPASIALPGAEFMPGTTTGTLVVSGLPSVSLAGSLDYVMRYPYGCAEQTISQSFPLLYFSEVVAQTAPGKYNPEVVRERAQAGVDRLSIFQNASGGIALWTGGAPDEWVSIYAAHFLLEARRAGLYVQDDVLNELLTYVSARASVSLDKPTAEDLSKRGYACYVLATAGRPVRDRAEQLYERRASLNAEGYALLSLTYSALGAKPDAAKLLAALEGAKVARATTRESGGIFRSPARELALIMAAQQESGADASAVAATGRALDALRKNGHWGSTQDDGFALWAFGRQLAAQKATAAGGFAALVNVGDVQGTASDKQPLNLQDDFAGKTASISVTGAAPAYAFWSIEGVPLRPDPKPVSKGLEIVRRYRDRDNNIVDPKNLQLGQFVIVEVEFPGKATAENVVIEDLLPAGLEVENANLASSEKAGGEEGGSDESSDESSGSSDEESGDSKATEDSESSSKLKESAGVTVARTEVRDDRMVAFVDVDAPEEGKVRAFRYAARAVAEGTFVLPAVTASAMYNPDIEARSTLSVAVIKNKK